MSDEKKKSFTIAGPGGIKYDKEGKLRPLYDPHVLSEIRDSYIDMDIEDALSRKNYYLAFNMCINRGMKSTMADLLRFIGNNVKLTQELWLSIAINAINKNMPEIALIILEKIPNKKLIIYNELFINGYQDEAVRLESDWKNYMMAITFFGAFENDTKISDTITEAKKSVMNMIKGYKADITNNISKIILCTIFLNSALGAARGNYLNTLEYLLEYELKDCKEFIDYDKILEQAIIGKSYDVLKYLYEIGKYNLLYALTICGDYPDVYIVDQCLDISEISNQPIFEGILYSLIVLSKNKDIVRLLYKRGYISENFISNQSSSMKKFIKRIVAE